MSYGRSRVKALENAYNNIIEADHCSGSEIDDPVTDLTGALQLCDELVTAQKKLLDLEQKLRDLSIQTRFELNPLPGPKVPINYSISPKRSLAYVANEDRSTHNGTRNEEASAEPTSCTGSLIKRKNVHFAKLPHSPNRGLIRKVVDKIGDLTHSAAYTPLLHPGWGNRDDLSRGAQAIVNKTKHKRVTNATHYERPCSPTKRAKHGHCTPWPEAYGFGDVGAELQNPKNPNYTTIRHIVVKDNVEMQSHVDADGDWLMVDAEALPEENSKEEPKDNSKEDSKKDAKEDSKEDVKEDSGNNPELRARNRTILPPMQKIVSMTPSLEIKARSQTAMPCSIESRITAASLMPI